MSKKINNMDDNPTNENTDNEPKTIDEIITDNHDKLWDYYSGLPNPKWYETPSLEKKYK